MLESQAKSHRLKVILAFAAIFVIWGSTYIAIRFTLESIPPFMMVAVRFLIAGAILYVIARCGGAARPERAHLLSTFILGILLLGFGTTGVVLAERTLPSGLVSLLVATIPFFVVLLQWLLPGGKHPGSRVLAGLVLGISGLFFLLGRSKVVGGGIDVAAVGCVLVGALASASGAVYSKTAKLPDSQQLAASLEMFFAGLVLLVISIVSGEFSQLQHLHVSPKSLAAMIYLIVFGSMVAFSAYVWLLRHVNPSRLSTYAFVNPVVAVFLGWALAGESVTVQTILGAGIILSAVWLITQPSRQLKITARVPVFTERQLQKECQLKT